MVALTFIVSEKERLAEGKLKQAHIVPAKAGIHSAHVSRLPQTFARECKVLILIVTITTRVMDPRRRGDDVIS